MTTSFLTSLATSRCVHLGCLRYWIRGRLNLTDGATGGGPVGAWDWLVLSNGIGMGCGFWMASFCGF